MQKIRILAAIGILIVSGCTATRKASDRPIGRVGETSAGFSVSEVLSNNISNENFYIAKADIRVEQENVAIRLGASFRFRKPDSLLVIVRSRTGIEAGRGLITKDTILINDRINRNLMIGSAKSLGSKYGIDAGLIYALLGDVIIEERDTRRKINCKDGGTSEVFIYDGRRIEYTFDCKGAKVVRTYFEGDVRSGNITIEYSDFTESGKIRFPQRIEMYDDLKSLKVVIEMKKIERPWSGSLRFIPGSGYRVVKIR